MKNYSLKRTLPALGLLGLGLAGCQPELEEPTSNKGTADFTKYVAVGNSLTAGFMDGGLYREGQLSSYPNLLAMQMAKAGGGAFVQPLFSEAQSNGSGYLKLTGFTATGSPITASVTTNLALRAGATAARPLYTKFTEPVNNLGVPGIRMSDIETAGYGSVQGNPYFERITPDASPTQTYRQRVAASQPTFFTFWLGNNDVLGYATSGGAGAGITSNTVFTTLANGILDDLTAGGAKGVVATIPDVTNIPFFTTVGPTLRATLTAGNVPGIVVTTGTFSTTPGTPATRKTIATTAIRDANGNGNQLFTLTAAPYLGLLGRTNNGKAWRDVYGQVRGALPPAVSLSVFLAIQGVDTTQAFGVSPGNPIPSTLVLDDVEQTTVRTATTAFNAALTTKATAKNLAIFDANAFFSRVAANGVVSNTVTNTAAYISGNLFSLDGVHPTPRGYAIIANEMIKVINTKYGSTLQPVDPNASRGVLLP
ncbi:SGNH/GDSL hydrolase family protein [Hymenobacter yonginensis]|uniref:SGNH/GDSL hydrolase family protein n=1 Tax=Hymenobacter yonginensis TaxID=748197 RepID=A0ABY7PMD1_9BACT|nr:SGNH/GDSL hydrolase family protein [Hymenobacter yonginensis]WBO84373.1 SGNH/GDSL hydrolase family protein [Hymenobacter yonginensis]